MRPRIAYCIEATIILSALTLWGVGFARATGILWFWALPILSGGEALWFGAILTGYAMRRQ